MKGPKDRAYIQLSQAIHQTPKYPKNQNRIQTAGIAEVDCSKWLWIPVFTGMTYKKKTYRDATTGREII